MDDIETVCQNSYRNFHTRDFDYLCLTRTEELTRKVYFFDGDLHDLPELVIPHNHRYPFTTTVLSGSVINRHYFGKQNGCQPDGTAAFDTFKYMTPLNGGDGFTWEGICCLNWLNSPKYTRGAHWSAEAADIHTLDIRCEGTVILLEQKADVVPLDKPTYAYRHGGGKVPPSLDGLYDKMTPDHARKRIEQFLDLVGNRTK